MSSSYSNKTLCYDDIFKLLTWQTRPRRIIEFGILKGYSLRCFAEAAPRETSITAYDIFEAFVGNSAPRDITDQFAAYPNVEIKEGDFYKVVADLSDASVDIIHIDIANDGAVYEFAFENYIRKLSPTGILLLEGGGAERDAVGWMTKYNKIPIRRVLERYESQLDIYTMSGFPSLTVVRRRHT